MSVGKQTDLGGWSLSKGVVPLLRQPTFSALQNISSKPLDGRGVQPTARGHMQPRLAVNEA